MRVDVINSERSFDAAPDETLLEAALAGRWQLPNRCRSGSCGLCRARVVEGEIRYPNGRPLGLSDADAAARCILLCQARAVTDLCLELFPVRPADAPGWQRLPCRIEAAELVAHDVMRILLRRPPAVNFVFEPGQYVEISWPGGSPRAFSIACPPHDSRLLELHVGRVEGGRFSQWLFGRDASTLRDALIDIEGPLGLFRYRDASAIGDAPGTCDAPANARDAPAGARPLLLVAGGTGLAPLLSIMRHVIENGIARSLTLYWGVRAARDLYAGSALARMQGAASTMRYVPVLSQPDPGWRGRTGPVHTAVLDDHGDLGAYDIYVAGPPAMIEAAQREFPLRGATSARLHSDAFNYAIDRGERQFSSAVTKS